MERIKQIANQLIEIAKYLKLEDLTHNCLFENSIKIYLSEIIQENKQNNIKAYQNKPESKPTDKPIDRPSDKQIEILNQFKVTNPEKLSKQEASIKIKELLQKRHNKQSSY